MWGPLKRHRVRLHMVDDGPTIEGVLWSKPRRSFHLKQASVYESADRSFTIEGDVFVPYERVAWVQVLR